MGFLQYLTFKAKATVCTHSKNNVFDFGPNLSHSVNYCPDCLTIVAYFHQDEKPVLKVGEKFEMDKTRI